MSKKRIAIFSIDAKLGHEVKGATRYVYLAETLAAEGYEVDFLTSRFQHWEKRQRDVESFDASVHSFNVRFIEEPGYPKNMCPQRIWAHHVMAKNMRAYFEEHHDYDLIYCQIPPNDVALAVGQSAKRYGIPFVVDVNDLWPEAFRIALDVPIVSDIAFAPFYRQARRTYALADAIVGTSDEYAARGFRDRAEDIPKVVAYVGNDLAAFDSGALAYGSQVAKPSGEFWVSYAGAMSDCYDLRTLVHAMSRLQRSHPFMKLKLMGDGTIREELEALVAETGCNVDFLGYMPYPQMAAYLVASDVLVNSLVENAPQSVPTKIGDYLAAGKPMLSTSMSPEFRAKVERDGFGVNVRPGDVEGLAAALERLEADASARERMGAAARAIAEDQFDRKHSYRQLVELVDRLTRSSR